MDTTTWTMAESAYKDHTPYNNKTTAYNEEITQYLRARENKQHGRNVNSGTV
jgi:hypothetical protein